MPPLAARNFLNPAWKSRVTAIETTLSPFRSATNCESNPAFRNLNVLESGSGRHLAVGQKSGLRGIAKWKVQLLPGSVTREHCPHPTRLIIER